MAEIQTMAEQKVFHYNVLKKKLEEQIKKQ